MKRLFQITRLFNSRSKQVVCALAALVATIAVYRSWDAVGMHPDYFWASKKASQSRAEVVITGDSRVVESICPAAMRQELGDLRAFNFAFYCAGYSRQYLAATLRALSADGARRIVVLGITPLSLTPTACRSSRFTATQAESPQKLMFCRLFNRVFFGVENIEIRSVGARGPQGEIWSQTYYEDGWVATSLARPDPNKALKAYRDELFKDNEVSPSVVASVADFIRQCRGGNIEVYAFRPPATPALDEVEDSCSGFDERGVAASLREAGAVWLEFCRDRYGTYDGCHMEPQSAQQFSQELARKLRQP